MAEHEFGDTPPFNQSTPSSSKSDPTHHIAPIGDQSLPSIRTQNLNRNQSSLASTSSPTSEASFLSSESDEIHISHVPLSAHILASSGSMDASTKHHRRSLFSPGTSRTGPASPTKKSFKLFSKCASSYNPPTTKTDADSSKDTTKEKIAAKRFSQRKLVLNHSRGTSVPEEEFDLNLLSAAMPMAYQGKRLDKTASAETELEDAPMVSPMAIPFDLSMFHEPMHDSSSLTPEIREQINRQEAAGILTGGLGAGFVPDSTITSRDLMADNTQSSSPASRLSHRLTLLNGLNRAPTLKDLAQNEANRRGEVIEVIVQEPIDAPVDISSFAGHAGAHESDFDFKSMDSLPSSIHKKATFKSSNVEVFYPQANWKPFSMRAPYLTALIIISVVLGAAEEYLYQKSRKNPLYSFTSASAMKTWDYFCFKYLPTLVAVIFGVLWQITDFEVKRLEAYYQLSKEGGALAAESINVDYITFFNVLRPFRALLFKHYAVAVSSIATLLAVSLVPTLQSASVILIPSREIRRADPTVLKGIVISGPWSRLLSISLWLCAIFGCILLWQLERRPSGLIADVKGVAGIAAMANRSHILMDFKDMDTATPDMIHQKLKAHHYTLRNSSLAPSDQILTQADKDKYDAHSHASPNPHPLFLRLIAGIPFVISMILFTLLIPIILFTPANIITDKAPWLLTLGAVSIKLCWGSLETAIRMIEPFYILSLRHSSPTALTLDYTAMAFGWLPIRAFLNGHYLVAVVGLGSVLAEILTVCVTSFSTVTGNDFTSRSSSSSSSSNTSTNGVDAGEETFASFWASFFLALSILIFLICISILSYTRRRHPFLPRQPSSIASILAFIYQSKMLYDFVGTEKLNNREMEQRLVGIGKRYGLGWFKGRDGEMHCGVDEEELSARYLHGQNKKAESEPWRGNWQDY